MTSQKSHSNTLIILKLILLSFLFSFPAAPALHSHKADSAKYAQLEIHADIVLLKSHSEAKHFKRLPFLDTIPVRPLANFTISSYSIAKSFFDFHTLHSSCNLQSALARAPPV